MFLDLSGFIWMNDIKRRKSVKLNPEKGHEIKPSRDLFLYQVYIPLWRVKT